MASQSLWREVGGKGSDHYRTADASAASMPVLPQMVYRHDERHRPTQGPVARKYRSYRFICLGEMLLRLQAVRQGVPGAYLSRLLRLREGSGGQESRMTHSRRTL